MKNTTSNTHDSGRYSREYVSEYYDKYGDTEWDRLAASAPNKVNLHIHTHYLQKFVSRSSKVLEIGAGPGRFTSILSTMDCRITIADVSQVQLDLNKKHAEELGFADSIDAWLLLDICELTDIDSDSFDAVVCYGGPLSYVFDRAAQAMSECVRVCRPGGHVLTSVMSLWGACHQYLPAIMEIPIENNRKIVATGDLTPENWDGAVHRCHMFKARELEHIAVTCGLQVAAISASNCLSLVHDEFLSKLAEGSAEWQELLAMEVETCADEGCLNMGTHIILVGQKV